MTVSGWNFTPSSVVCWNQSAPLELPTAYVNSTTLTAQVSAADLQNAGHAAVQVMEPSGSTTSGMLFTIGLAPVPGLTVVNTIANDLVWDPVYQKIYLSLPSSDGVNGNTVQVLDPLTGTLGASAFAGSEPNLLAVSNTSKYLYVSLNGAPNVQRMTLPNFGTDISIPLGSNQLYGPFYALDLEAAPNSDNTVAVVRELPGLSPEGSAGVVIYDDRTARSNILCGPGQAQSNSCANITWTGPYDFIQWSADGCTMFATNDETTGADFYTIPVTTSGFGTGTDYKGVLVLAKFITIPSQATFILTAAR
jgi:hypothetical protein